MGIPKQQRQVPNVPAVSGGRSGNTAPPPDDFGLALQDAFNKFGKGKRR